MKPANKEFVVEAQTRKMTCNRTHLASIHVDGHLAGSLLQIESGRQQVHGCSVYELHYITWPTPPCEMRWGGGGGGGV